LGGAKSAGPGAEIAHRQLVTDARRPRADVGQTVVAHGALSFVDSPTVRTSDTALWFRRGRQNSRLSRKSRLRATCRLKNNHAADRFALAHQGESLIDVAKRHRVGDHRVDLDSSFHVPVDDFRQIRPRAPPKAVPRQTRPVTNWNGRVDIS